MGGARIALILQIREVLFKFLHLKEKEQGYTLNKATINKIKREIDVPWIGKIINVICNDRLSLEMFELHYDKLFLVAEEPQDTSKLRDFTKKPLKGITGINE